ncbi:MAG: hypothetical protein EXX96DRAFT_567229 [Benjaminiella poitrasii]|nr:MAG: hypothetical protein EXX96DRAFT_567229 [Benjaminiella poitrasii]
MELKRLQTLLDKQSTSSPNDEQKQLEEIQFENTNLRSSVNKLQTENEELRNLYSSTQNQMEAAKVENTRLKSSANQLENAQRRLETENAQLKASFELKSEAESRYKALETTEKELLVENEKLKLANGPEHEHKLKLVELKEINNTQKKELSHLKSEFRLLTDKNTSLHNQIKHYEDHLSSLEKENQSIQADRKNQILELQSDIQSLESKLSQETKNTEKIKLYYEEKIKSQASDYDQFIHQIKSECNDLKQRFDQLDEDNKARESLPASITESNLTSTVQEDKSILTAMWQRDREILKVAQKALEKSENDLALSRNQVLQLRKEVKYLQKQHVFEQSKGINDINEDINEDVDIAPPVKKDNVITYQTIQKMKKPVPPIPQSNKIENNKDARINIITSPISVLRDTKDDQQLLNSIKRERNLIQSTKKTIAARAKLSRAKGEVDRELSLSLERAHTTVSLLESQLKNKPFSPSDFLVTSKKPLV